MARTSIALLLFGLITMTFAWGDDIPDSVPIAEPGKGICLAAQLIYSLEDKPTPQCHASTIAETPA